VRFAFIDARPRRHDSVLLAVHKIPAAQSQPPRPCRCSSTSLDRVPFHGRAAQRDCHRACVWTRKISVAPYTDRAGLDGTALVVFSKNSCRLSAATRLGSPRSSGLGKFRKAGVASDSLARAVVRNSWNSPSWRPSRRARQTNGSLQSPSEDAVTRARGPPRACELVCSFLFRGNAGPAFKSCRVDRAGMSTDLHQRRQLPWAN